MIRRRRLDERLTANAYTDRPHPDPAGHFGAADLVRRLSPERRAAFVLTQLLGLSYAEAAAVEECRWAPSAPGSPGPATSWSRRSATR
ncbi:hypothetical protein GCM10027614_63290 [Micromonospora vulcania]